MADQVLMSPLTSAQRLELNNPASTTMKYSTGFRTSALATAAVELVAALARGASDVTPTGLALGGTPSPETSSFGAFTLNDSSPVATLDYGIERGGYAFFTLSSLSQPVQIEVRYSEPFAGLNDPFSDGPFLFSPMLANSFRAETFNVTGVGRFVAPLLQGGQRWQSITLLTGGSITFDSVGLEATVDTTAVDELPGFFDSSDETLNEVWKLGALAASTACVVKGSQGAVWEVDPEKGVLVRSTKPSLTLDAIRFSSYTLDFETNIARGGVWWSVASTERTTAIQLMLVGELLEETTFVNTNRSLSQPNSVLLAYGFNFLDQTFIDSYLLGRFPVPFNVSEGSWYNVSTALSQNGYLSVSVGHEQIFNVSLGDYNVGGTISTSGTFGFGAWQDQAAYVRNVAVTDTATGAGLYSNSMTSTDVLAEYGTQANVGSVCLDGPKRDRTVWLGDFYHTARIIAASTSRHDLSRGTLQLLLDTQNDDGELALNPPLGYDPSNTYNTTGDLIDYQFLGLASLHSYVQHSNDLSFVAATWPRWQKAVSFLLSTISPADGLVHVPVAFLGQPQGGSAVSCLAVQALRNLAEIATALNDTSSGGSWTSAADSLAAAINAQLWDDSQGVYIESSADPTNFAITSTAFCITSGVADQTRAERSIAATEARLKLAPGYRDSTAADVSTAYISPNTNGFLLDALFITAAAAASSSSSSQNNDNTTTTEAADLVSTAGALVRSLWGAMLDSSSSSSRDQTKASATGASWEYVSQSGDPGLGLFTSLAHPWGGAATYVLTERVLGLRPAGGVAGFGYARWVVDVSAGVLLGLTRAGGGVVLDVVGTTTTLRASWVVVDADDSGGGGDDVPVRVLQCNVTAPAGTVGVFVYLGRSVALEGDTTYNVTINL
ncbi:RhaA is able to hydrolyze alpha-1 [Diaporthe helianthi]|uniref:RhaA is able to hydrolyze alpha-1 n=1 Tax=Diaporthe helianthi TaxID=158607 RepID=A0A2P5HU07_DIAHE|nr:RhaA is able to hydrolyze alpha-1 [Diaporthe helianthi]